MAQKKVLIIYYSCSGQSQLLVQRLASGLASKGVEVSMERLQPVSPLPFPFPTLWSLIRVLVLSFWRWRVPVRQPTTALARDWDLVVLAGPTWSYNPSGPILSFLDTYGKRLCSRGVVLPLISCRSYWRTHYWGLKRIISRYGATVMPPLVFTHSGIEPYRTIGLFLQMAGKLPRRESSWFRKRYPRFGHSREQAIEAFAAGEKLAGWLAATTTHEG